MGRIKYLSPAETVALQQAEVKAAEARTAAQLASGPRVYTNERSRREHQAFLVELHQQEEAARVKAEAPLRKLEAELQENANKLAQMEAANLLIIPDESPDGKKLMAYCDHFTEAMVERFTFNDWSLLSEAGMKDAVTLWTLEKTALPNAEELTLCKAYLLANKLSPGDGNSWVSALARLTGFCLRLGPVPVAEPEPVVEIKLVLKGRDKERAEKLEFENAVVSEMSPTWVDAVQSLVDSSGLTMDRDNQRALFDKVSHSKLLFNKANIRRVAIGIWGEACGLTPGEKAAYDQHRADRDLSSDEYLKKYGLGNPRTKGIGGGELSRPISRVRQAGA